jgi:uncharacterized protein YceK
MRRSSGAASLGGCSSVRAAAVAGRHQPGNEASTASRRCVGINIRSVEYCIRQATAEEEQHERGGDLCCFLLAQA